MILCPGCQHHELVGALFCSECGEQLVALEPREMVGQALPRNITNSQPPGAEMVERPSPNPESGQNFTLQIMGGSTAFPITDSQELILGRASSEQPVLPDIDLTPHQAYKSGVSRMHALIRRQASSLTITDLESANGTWVNNQKIPPRLPHPLYVGDIIRLGNLRLRVGLNEKHS